MSFFTKIGAVGLYVNDSNFDFAMLGMAEGNPNGIYLIDVGFYMLNGFALIFSAILDIFVVCFGLTFYANRV